MQETERLERFKLQGWMDDWLKTVQSFNHSVIQPGSFKILFTFIFLINPLSVSAQVYPDQKVDSLLRSGIENIILHNYDSAAKTFIILEKEYPGIPFGKIYLAANEIARSYDLAEPFNSDFIKTKIKEAAELSEKLLNADNKNIWNYYFLALAKGYEAYFEALNENWLSAFGTGITSVNIFEEILDMDPEFHDALIAIGTYKYWKSRKMNFLTWLPFISNEREEGVRLLEKTVRNGSYNTYLAANSLVWIYIDKGEFEKAIKTAEEALFNYPGSRIFNLGLARAYEDVDKQKTIDYYYSVLNSFSEKEKSNRYNEIVLKHHLAQQYARIGERAKAIQLCDEILAINNLTNFIKNKLGNRLERVQRLKTELSR
jgi:tetratricopeptide (TPR) repeat protein